MKLFYGLIGLFALCISQIALAVDPPVVGLWSAIDDKTGKESSLIKIWQDPATQKYYGKISKIFDENGQKQTDRCESCSGALHDHPMLGMVIITDMVYQGNGLYSHGRVLDPRNGSNYHAQMRVLQDGQLLKLRGYIGIPLLGRTAEWHRVKAQQ